MKQLPDSKLTKEQLDHLGDRCEGAYTDLEQSIETYASLMADSFAAHYFARMDVTFLDTFDSDNDGERMGEIIVYCSVDCEDDQAADAASKAFSFRAALEELTEHCKNDYNDDDRPPGLRAFCTTVMNALNEYDQTRKLITPSE